MIHDTKSLDKLQRMVRLAVYGFEKIKRMAVFDGDSDALQAGHFLEELQKIGDEKVKGIFLKPEEAVEMFCVFGCLLGTLDGIKENLSLNENQLENLVTAREKLQAGKKILENAESIYAPDHLQ